jgi:hypothetical protein
MEKKIHLTPEEILAWIDEELKYLDSLGDIKDTPKVIGRKYELERLRNFIISRRIVLPNNS